MLKKYSDDFSKYFGACVSEDYVRYTRKNLTKVKFIIAASACPLKPLSRYITSVFKLSFNQVKLQKVMFIFFRC